MKDFEKINTTVAPYYTQFEKLGDLFEIESIDFPFLKSARKFFAKQYFFELKLIVKRERRILKQEFRDTKQAEKQAYKKAHSAKPT